jgi:hypothetical protein
MKKITFLFILLFIAISMFGTIPNLINFQGALTQGNSSPVNTTVDITFRIYDQENAGTKLWEETQIAVQINQGIFNTVLGNITPLPSTIFNGDPVWITFRISGEQDEMYPRQKILPVPYSFRSKSTEHATRADTATTINGVPVNNLVLQDNSGNVTIWGNVSATEFHGNGSHLTDLNTACDSYYVNVAGPDSIVSTYGQYALAIRSNSTGLEILNARHDGIKIDRADWDAIKIKRSYSTGIEIENTTLEGINIGKVGNVGFKIDSCYVGLKVLHSSYGIKIENSSNEGIVVNNTTSNGLSISNAGNNGIDVTANNYAVQATTNDSNDEYGLFSPDKLYGMNLTSRALNIFGLNKGNQILEPGDIVCISGGYNTNVLEENESIPIINVEK